MMKMQTTIYAAADGVVSEINVQVGENVESKDLLAKLRVRGVQRKKRTEWFAFVIPAWIDSIAADHRRAQ